LDESITPLLGDEDSNSRNEVMNYWLWLSARMIYWYKLADDNTMMINCFTISIQQNLNARKYSILYPHTAPPMGITVTESSFSFGKFNDK
jgi:hypothetical protein